MTKNDRAVPRTASDSFHRAMEDAAPHWNSRAGHWWQPWGSTPKTNQAPRPAGRKERPCSSARLRVLVLMLGAAVVAASRLAGLPGHDGTLRPLRTPARMASLWAMPRRAAKCLLTSRLRGGLWYDPQEDKDEEEREEEDEEDGDESYYTTTEDDDGAYDQAGGVLSQMGSQTFELPDGRRVTAGDELPVRLGDDMTLEQAESDTRIAPPGTFAGGCDLFLAEALLPRMRSSWVDGKVPREETTPLHLYDVYGLEEYVRLAGEEDEIRGYPFDPSAPDANHPRNLLKVPLEPTPRTMASSSPFICVQISGPVTSSCACGLDGLLNWLMKKAPSISEASRLARSW